LPRFSLIFQTFFVVSHLFRMPTTGLFIFAIKYKTAGRRNVYFHPCATIVAKMVGGLECTLGVRKAA
jgi:hypothetical protein